MGVGLGGRHTQTLPTTDWMSYKGKAESFKIKYSDDGVSDLIQNTRKILISSLVIRSIASGVTGLALRNKLLEAQKLMRLDDAPH